jgi:hypothetical protein
VRTGAHREAFRDDSLACGYRWRSADEAIHYAMNRARELIRSRSQMLHLLSAPPAARLRRGRGRDNAP